MLAVLSLEQIATVVVMHLPLSHTKPGAQSEVDAHVLLQSPSPQPYGAHDMVLSPLVSTPSTHVGPASVAASAPPSSAKAAGGSSTRAVASRKVFMSRAYTRSPDGRRWPRGAP